MRNKWVIYTSIVGNYDNMPIYEHIDTDFDYICFSNDFEEGSYIGHWRIKNLSEKIKDSGRLSRYPKINPHIVLPEYEYSIWIDGNVSIVSKGIYDDIRRQIETDVLWCGIIHPQRDCVFEEIKFCLFKGKGELISLLKSGLFLRLRKFPKHSGLLENNFILRKHNVKSVIGIDVDWWKLYMLFSTRDQITLPYVLSQNSFVIKPFLTPPLNIAQDSRFDYSSHSHCENKRSNIFFSFRKLILYAIELLKLF